MLTTTETKKAQLSLFIILGIALLLSAGLLLLTKEKPKTKTPEAELEQEALAVQKYIDQCLQQALTGAENTGLREDQKEQQEAIQKAYVQYSMKSCADLKTFEKQGLQTSAKEPEATISLEGNVLAAILKYPVKVRKGQAEITLSAFSHYIKKEASATITQDQYGTTTERTIITDDKKAELHIPAETRISFPDSTNTLSLKVVDKSTNGQKNQEVLGELAYLASPSGTTLTPGAQLTLKYNTELSTLPPQTTEEQLNIAVAYYDDTQQRWIPLPTTLDRANKKATATITSLGLFTTITTSQAEQNPRQQPPHQDLQATIQGPSQTKPDQKEKYVANAKHQTAQGEYKKINKLEIWAKRQDGQDMQGCAEKKGKWCLLDRYAQQSEGTARRETETSLKEGKYTIAVNAYAEDRKCSGNPEPGWESCGVDSKIDVSVTTGIQTPGTQPSAGEPDHYPTFARFVDEYKLPNAKDIKNCCSTNARIYPEMAIPEEGQKSGCIRIVCEKTQADSKYYLAMYIKEEIKNDRQQPDTTGRCTGLKGNRDTNDFLARACGNTYAASPTTYRPSQTALDTYLQTRCPQLAGIGQCAMQTAAETGISPLILLAIPINEGACATNTISSDSKCPETGKQVNNLYGIKCARGQGTAGCCSYGTWEEIGGTRTDVTASFRAYNNKCESVKDFPAFLASSPRYEKALSAKNNPEEMIREMKNAGYATDSKWPDKIIMIMNQIKAAVGTETIHTSSETSGNIIQQLSPNHGGPMGEIKGVVIHSTRGLQVPGRELQAAVNWFMNPQSMVSAHRIIGVNGEQYKMVEDGITAWHAGEYNNNYLGIELEQGKPEDPYRDAQYRTAAQTVKEWSRKYGFPLTRNQNTKTVLGHDETTQGISIGKTDPGRKFNWNKFMSLLTEQENTR